MNKIILVTGGNRGIGQEICKQLASYGHIILLASRNLEKGKKVAASIQGNVTAVKLDVTSKNDIKNLKKFIKNHYGHLDVLINNAGIIGKNSTAIEASLTEVKKTIETNFFSPWELSQSLYPLLIKSSDPRIINMSSGLGSISDMGPGHAGYRMSKTALNGLTAFLSTEMAGQIKVNSMCPGWVRTSMGGPNAPRPVEKGAETAVWLATSNDIGSGHFYRDKQVIPW